MLQQHAQEIGENAIKTVPPAAVAAANTFGMSVPDFINYLTVIWLSCLIIAQLWKSGVKVHEWRLRRKRNEQRKGR